MEPLVLRAGGALVRSALKVWLTDRRNQRERAASLADLVNVRLRDDFQRRRFKRELEALVDMVAQRLLPLCRQEFAGMEEGDRLAAIAEVATTFETAPLSDARLFDADADASKLAKRLRENLPNAARRAGLGEAASSFYDILLDECCTCYVQLVVHLTPFAARASAELLGRVSALSEQLALVLERLPMRTLMAPSGTAQDKEFRLRYLALIGESLDDVELFGVDIRRYRPRTTLSVAYISLSVRAQPGQRSRGQNHRFDDAVRWRIGTAPEDDRTMRVERALASDRRMLIRGEAGSGKSTLLKWLAINAARGTFRGELADLNGHVPFLIKLRSHARIGLPNPENYLDEPAQPLVALMPDGFVHRQLAASRALVLVDGVDELPAGQRGQVRDWLNKLVHTFPESRLIVTSRPGAASASWLQAEGFGSAFLERMSPSDIRTLVRHWHLAARDAGGLPCDDQELPRYEGALLSRLDGNPHLQALATTPLLCAMLCALNLDRRSYLPRDRLELYHAALTLLLDRRDTERHIPSAEGLGISGRDKRQLLRHLAWRLSVNGRSELLRAEVIRRLTDKLTAMPRLQCDADQLLDHFVHRSGVIREPVPGRIDFVHRTFQEYLTAEEAADQGDIGLLVEHAHLDQWRDVIVMATGLANAPLRTELVEGLLDRADAEPRHRRHLGLLAASALEATSALAPPLTDRMNRCLAQLVPPRRVSEARSLASVGESVLPHLMTDPGDLSEASAAAVVRTAALINGSAAWPVLERFASDPRHRVQQELITAWEYFDPQEYATRVLAEAPLLDGRVTVRNPLLLPSVTTLGKLTDLYIELENITNLDSLTRLTSLKGASLSGEFNDLTPLSRCRELENVLISTGQRFDPRPLTGLPNLTSLFLYPSTLSGIEFLYSMTGLARLGLAGLHQVSDLTPLTSLRQLKNIALYGYPDGTDLTPLRQLPDLTSLDLGMSSPQPACPPGSRLKDGLSHIADTLPHLTELGLLYVNTTDELRELARLAHLHTLSIRNCHIRDLTPLASIKSLTCLQIAGPLVPTYLEQIKHLKQLTAIEILINPNDTKDIDLSALGNRHLTIRTYRHRHRIIGVGKGIKIKWLDA